MNQQHGNHISGQSDGSLTIRTILTLDQYGIPTPQDSAVSPNRWQQGYRHASQSTMETPDSLWGNLMSPSLTSPSFRIPSQQYLQGSSANFDSVSSFIVSRVMDYNFNKLACMQKSNSSTLKLLGQEDRVDIFATARSGLDVFKVRKYGSSKISGTRVLGLVCLSGSILSNARDLVFVGSFPGFIRQCCALFESGRQKKAEEFLRSFCRHSDDPNHGGPWDSPFYVIQRLLCVLAGANALLDPQSVKTPEIRIEENAGPEAISAMLDKLSDLWKGRSVERGGLPTEHPLYEALQSVVGLRHESKRGLGRQLIQIANLRKDVVDPEDYVTFVINVVELFGPSFMSKNIMTISPDWFSKYVQILEYHLKKVEGLCPDCKKAFTRSGSTRGNVNRHIESVHNKDPKALPRCDGCDRLYKRSDNLRRHMEQTGCCGA